MARIMMSALVIGLVWLVSAPAQAQLKPELIKRGKSATALVEVTHEKGGGTGSGFCVDKSGLFITNAHVIEDATGEVGTVRLVVDIGLETQRILAATVLRRDDELDLALLQAENPAGLTPLELGRDADLRELARVVTFGYPFGKDTVLGRVEYPDVTVLPSRITSLRQDKGQLLAIQFDNQINPGNSGGPVLDVSGKVVGVARAAVLGAALNLAIPVGRLARFLKAPELVFDPPEFSYFDRTNPVDWTVRVQPPMRETMLPDDLSVAVTITSDDDAPRTITAQRVGVGSFHATVTPVIRDPDWIADLNAAISQGRFTRHEQFPMRVKDADVRGGGTRLMLAVLRTLLGGRSPRAATAQEPAAIGPNLRLVTMKKNVDQKTVTLDLNQATGIAVWARNPPRVQTVVVQVEARQGTKVLATVRRRTRITLPREFGIGLMPNQEVFIRQWPLLPPASPGPDVDDGRLKLGGVLDAAGIPRGAGKSIRPPRVAIPPARLTPDATDAPLVRRLDGTISDITVGGGGRYLLLTLKKAQKLAVFDVNAAEIVKTIPLPSAKVLVAAGARKLLIAFPEEKLLQRWDLETLQREGGSRPSPIDFPMIGLALGSDSDGPALAFWSSGGLETDIKQTRFSFIDLDSLTVLRVGLIASLGDRSLLSPSGGSFAVNRPDERDQIRASAGGAFFGTSSGALKTLSVHGRVIIAASYPGSVGGHVVPGPDGRTLLTGLRGRLDLDGNPIGLGGPARKGSPEATIPSSDPAYCLSVGGLADILTYGFVNPKSRSPDEAVTASIHAADGSRLLTVHGLDEMASEVKAEDGIEWIRSGFTIDKRFYLVPPAHLLITIPPENDRLVLRRLDLEEALDRAGGNYLIVVSTPILGATAGQTLEHRIVARSKQGGIIFTLSSGPDGLKVAPDGRLTWTVPQDLKGEDVAAVVKVEDASGQERSHRLEIRVK